MQLSSLILLASATLSSACIYSRSVDDPAWSYTGATGPVRWHSLSDSFSLCGTGSHQSPIDLSSSISTAPAGTVVQHYPESADLNFFNNGHAVEAEPLSANASTGSHSRVRRHSYGRKAEPATYKATIGGHDHELLQFHFHTPSEHTLHGRSYPLEVHFVHKNLDTNGTSVVGVFFDIGNDAAVHADWFKKLAPAVTTIKEKDQHTEVKNLNLKSVMDNVAEHGVLNYSGSLTTPPCSEQIAWWVSESPMAISAKEWKSFADVLGFNSRYTQAASGGENLLEGQDCTSKSSSDDEEQEQH